MSNSGPKLRAPLFWLLMPLMGGLALQECCPARLGSPAAFALAAALSALAASLALWSSRQLPWALALTAAALACGYGLGTRHRLPPPAWSHTPREVNVTLEIEQVFASPPTRKTFAGLARIVETESHLPDLRGQRVYFSAIRKISQPPLRSGSYRARGVLQPVLPAREEAGKNFEEYLAALGIELTLVRTQLAETVQPPGAFVLFCEGARLRLEAALREGLELRPRLLSLYFAMLLGEKAELSEEQQSAFMRTGTFHIFSISGLHVGVIALAIQSLLQLLRVPRRVAVLVGLSALWLYVQITGASIPAQRAFVMILFLMGARAFRLPANALAAIALAAFVTLLLHPRDLFSAGFQMSYAVVTALIVMGLTLHDRLQALWQPWRDLPEANRGQVRQTVLALGRKCIALVAATWVAFLASTPSSIGNFGVFSPGALLANLAIIPLSFFALNAGFVSLLGSLCGLNGVSLVFNHAAALLIGAMDWLTLESVRLPGVAFEASYRARAIAPVGLLLVVGTMFVGASLRWPARRLALLWPVVVLAALLILGVKFGAS